MTKKFNKEKKTPHEEGECRNSVLIISEAVNNIPVVYQHSKNNKSIVNIRNPDKHYNCLYEKITAIRRKDKKIT